MRRRSFNKKFKRSRKSSKRKSRRLKSYSTSRGGIRL